MRERGESRGSVGEPGEVEESGVEWGRAGGSGVEWGRAGGKWGRAGKSSGGYWGWGGIPNAIQSPPELLTWAAMRAILMFALIMRGEVPRQCPQTTTFKERREAKQRIQSTSSAYRPNALLPGQTG